jgi:hypothetical protein
MDRKHKTHQISSRSENEETTKGKRVHCPLTKNNLALYAAKFRLDLMVGFMAKNVITNHGEVDHRRLKLMSAINWFS